jgi:hypothetical protein
MSLRKPGQYWTVYSGDQPIMSYPTFEQAWRAIWDLHTAISQGNIN